MQLPFRTLTHYSLLIALLFLDFAISSTSTILIIFSNGVVLMFRNASKCFLQVATTLPIICTLFSAVLLLSDFASSLSESLVFCMVSHSAGVLGLSWNIPRTSVSGDCPWDLNLHKFWDINTLHPHKYNYTRIEPFAVSTNSQNTEPETLLNHTLKK